jgi:ABC-type transport system involved in multi-copper enzyme maturation permease subunit
MTIFGSGYRAIEYVSTSPLARWLVLARSEFRLQLRGKRRVLLYLFCHLQNWMSLIVMMIWAGFWQLGGDRPMPMGGRAFGDPSNIDFYLASVTSPAANLATTTLVTLSVVRSIARDRQSGALEIQWTRGVSPLGYFLGKWIGGVLVLGSVAVAAPAALWIVASLNSSEDGFFGRALEILPRFLLANGAFTVITAGLATALSSAPRTANVASILWAVGIAGGAGLARVAVRLSGHDDAFYALSPVDCLRTITRAIGGLEPQPGPPLTHALVALACVAILLALLLRRRLRLDGALA